jgi:hypothetical protein
MNPRTTEGRINGFQCSRHNVDNRQAAAERRIINGNLSAHIDRSQITLDFEYFSEMANKTGARYGSARIEKYIKFQ